MALGLGGVAMALGQRSIEFLIVCSCHLSIYMHLFDVEDGARSPFRKKICPFIKKIRETEKIHTVLDHPDCVDNIQILQLHPSIFILESEQSVAVSCHV
jgi:hypothetical protein